MATRDADAPGHLHLALIAERGRPACRGRAISDDLSLILRRRGLPSLPHRRIDLCIREDVRGDRAPGGARTVG